MNLKTIIGVVAAVALAALFFWFGGPESFKMPGTQDMQQASNEDLSALKGQLATPVSEGSFTEVVSGLKVAVVLPGTGETIAQGKIAAVHYVGRLQDGTQFDSSVDRGEPLVFEYGAQQLIAGFEKGMEGMKVGEIRRLIISPELGYGARGVSLPDGTVVIAPNATLMFDVALVGIGDK